MVRDTRGAGVAALKRRLRGGKAQVYVGVPAGKVEEDGTPIALVAAVNEFGSADGKIPERSFLRAGLREFLPEARRLNRGLLAAVARGTMSEDRALGLLGSAAAGAVKTKMQRGPFVPNAPSTIRQKKSDRPLFDHGQLYQSITWVIGGGHGVL